MTKLLLNLTLLIYERHRQQKPTENVRLAAPRGSLLTSRT